MELFNRPNMLYWLFIAIIIPIEHLTLGRTWQRQEDHRWTLGMVTVFAPAPLMIKRGYWDFKTVATLFVAVGISGALKVGLKQFNKSRKAENTREEWQVQKTKSNSYLIM